MGLFNFFNKNKVVNFNGTNIEIYDDNFNTNYELSKNNPKEKEFLDLITSCYQKIETIKSLKLVYTNQDYILDLDKIEMVVTDTYTKSSEFGRYRKFYPDLLDKNITLLQDCDKLLDKLNNYLVQDEESVTDNILDNLINEG